MVQDSFIRAHRSMRASDRELALKPWLYTIVRNRAVDHMRRPSIHTARAARGRPRGAASELNDPAARVLERERVCAWSTTSTASPSASAAR